MLSEPSWAPSWAGIELGSTARTNEFLELAGRKVPLDNCTRWNSWFLMLVIAVEKAGAIDTYTKNHFPTLEADYDGTEPRCISEQFE